MGWVIAALSKSCIRKPRFVGARSRLLSRSCSRNRTAKLPNRIANSFRYEFDTQPGFIRCLYVSILPLRCAGCEILRHVAAEVCRCQVISFRRVVRKMRDRCGYDITTPCIFNRQGDSERAQQITAKQAAPSVQKACEPTIRSEVS